jgi:Ca2+/Na+ antiporter
MDTSSLYLVALVVFGMAVATVLTGGAGCPVLVLVGLAFLLAALAHRTGDGD